MGDVLRWGCNAVSRFKLCPVQSLAKTSEMLIQDQGTVQSGPHPHPDPPLLKNILAALEGSLRIE